MGFKRLCTVFIILLLTSSPIARGNGSDPTDEPGSSDQAHPPVTPTEHSSERMDEQRPASNGVPHNPSGLASNDTTGEWSGYVSLEPRLFFRGPEYPKQDDQNVSIAFKPEYYVDWAGGSQRFAFSPFLRYDANDDERTHADVREFYWSVEHNQLLFKAGLDVVFWGVAESRHLVDIINQTDLVENIDGEEKLGQPMLNLDYLSDWGTWQLYVMPYFRERTFPGEDGRLRTNPAVNTNDAQYESNSKENHIDVALRWSRYIGDWDIGLAHFSGTSREPLLFPKYKSSGALQLEPFYQQIDQTSVDAQATMGAWLWKLEAIYNQNNVDDFYAYVGGFEYTQFGVAGSPGDLGWLLEYSYDNRGEYEELGDSATNALQNDIFFGVRWTGNDLDSSELLATIAVDVDNGSSFTNIEASRRLGESWTLGLELRVFIKIDQKDLLYFFRHDDYLELQITRHF